MSILSQIGNALGSVLGYDTFGDDAGDYLSNNLLGGADTNPTGSSSSSGLLNPGFLSAALQSATGLAGGLYQNKANEDEAKKQREYELEQLKLKAKYGLLGGGGGGGADRDALLYKAYQDYLSTRQANRQNIGEAYQNLGSSAQRALRR